MLVDGETALIADTPHAFADAVVRLYRDQELWQRVSARSVAHIIEHFSDDAVRRRLRRLFPLPVPGSLPHDVAEMSVS